MHIRGISYSWPVKSFPLEYGNRGYGSFMNNFRWYDPVIIVNFTMCVLVYMCVCSLILNHFMFIVDSLT